MLGTRTTTNLAAFNSIYETISNMSSTRRRPYDSERRRQAADVTRERVLNTAKGLFGRHGIDRVTMAQVADRAGVAVPTVYAIFGSKVGILRALMRATLFGPRFQKARAKLEGVTDPVRLIALTAHVARAIYEGESSELGLLRGAAAFSPSLRKLEREFEKIRFEMQRNRLRRLFAESRQKKGLAFTDARRILWMCSSRDVYRMLVHEGGWTPARYQKWLSETLVDALVERRIGGSRAAGSD
jgi:AcrR family transcriptional regulator